MTPKRINDPGRVIYSTTLNVDARTPQEKELHQTLYPGTSTFRKRTAVPFDAEVKKILKDKAYDREFPVSKLLHGSKAVGYRRYLTDNTIGEVN